MGCTCKRHERIWHYSPSWLKCGCNSWKVRKNNTRLCIKQVFSFTFNTSDINGVIILDIETNNDTYGMSKLMASLILSRCSANTFIQYYVSHFNRSRCLVLGLAQCEHTIKVKNVGMGMKIDQITKYM